MGSSRIWRSVCGVCLGVGLLVACDHSAPPGAPAPSLLASVLTFYDWAGDMPQGVLDAFTQVYGVKVNYLTYESQEQAMDNLRSGQVYDVVVMESRDVPVLAGEGLLAKLDHRILTNLKNIGANFRDLTYDPGNRYSVPYNWGITGLVVRTDLVAEPVRRWSDLWDPRYAGRVGLWLGQQREVIALTLKSLGYSANSEHPAELEAALQRLSELLPRVVRFEEFDPTTSAKAMNSDRVVLGMGYSADLLAARKENEANSYVLPEEGALLWGDTFVIPSNSPHKHTAEVFIDFLLRGEINARIANENRYATPNLAARPFIDPVILNDPVVFPPNRDMERAELLLSLSPAGKRLYDTLWARLMRDRP